MEIVDQKLLSGEVEGLIESRTQTNAESKLEMCLISTVKVGIACSMITVKDRMDVRDAKVEMQGIRDLYFGVGIHSRNN